MTFFRLVRRLAPAFMQIPLFLLFIHLRVTYLDATSLTRKTLYDVFLPG